MPTRSHGHLAPHPWCADCGIVAVVGGDRATDLGGLVNRLAVLERNLARHGKRITEAQRRLIVKRLQAIGADDRFGLTRDQQDQLILRHVGATLGLTTSALESYTRSC